MYKVSFVNPNFQQGPIEYNSYYIPYSIGVIWAYVQKFAHLRHFELDRMIWRREPIQETAQRLAQSNIVGFSNYIWNANYNYKLARTVKAINPNCLIIFGGPQVEVARADLFERHPYMDLAIKQEGERTFRRILEQFETQDFAAIPGMLINRQGQAVDTGKPERIDELDEIPSPYLTGVFDQLFVDHPDVEWNATIESNRGCPYACTFCDWGGLTYSKVKKFEIQRVLDELEWVGQHRCGWITLCDANFGIFPERDELIANKLLEIQRKYNAPTHFVITWAKNQNREVVKLAKKFAESDSGYGFTLSFQSFDEQTLVNIKRKNLVSEKASEIFNYFNEHGVPVYSELILGLPGETLQTWRENFWTLFRLGNHNNITIYQCQVLENTEMNHVQREIYDIKTVNVEDYFLNNTIEAHDPEVREGIDVIASTVDLPMDDMIEAQIFTWFINTFHINGLTDTISRFLQKYRAVDYREFYEKFEQFVSKDPWFQTQRQEIHDYYYRWFTPDPNNQKFDSRTVFALYLTTIDIHKNDRYSHVWNLIRTFCEQEFALDPVLFQDLMQVQEYSVINYNRLDQYPMTIKTQHNILGYINADQALNQPREYRVQFNKNHPEAESVSITTFCEKIWYARRKNYGKTSLHEMLT